jgi:hypothetical protein
MDRLVDFGLPGLVFLALVVWLVRKVVRAARTESDLEGERLTGTLADELRKAKNVARGQEGRTLLAPLRTLDSVGLGPLEGADVRGASAEHLRIVEALAEQREGASRAAEGDVARRVEVLWVKSTATHAVWCERRYPANLAAAGMARDIVCIARIAGGKAVERWSY